MKCVSVQIHPANDGSYEVDDLLALVRSIGRYPEVDSDEGDSHSVNLNFFTEDLQRFWREFQEGVLNDAALGPWVRKTAIIVCEGDQGWDDYLLLWHYDQTHTADRLM